MAQHLDRTVARPLPIVVHCTAARILPRLYGSRRKKKNTKKKIVDYKFKKKQVYTINIRLRTTISGRVIDYVSAVTYLFRIGVHANGRQDTRIANQPPGPRMFLHSDTEVAVLHTRRFL